MLEQEGYDLIGAAMDVYNEMGNGFLEDVYQECLELELKRRGIAYVPQIALEIFFKGEKLNKQYRPDLVVYDQVVVELKAIRKLGENEYAQLFNYLKITGKRVGYLINFGATDGLDWKRLVL